jgi:hypothetical protein
MKIKKPKTIKTPIKGAGKTKVTGAVGSPSSSGAGALPEAALKNGTVGKKAATCAFAFALIGLAVAGILTYILYKHWEFLMPA